MSRSWSPALLSLIAMVALGGCGAEKPTEPPPPPPPPPVVVDRSPPTVEWLNGPATISPGSVVEFRFRARDSVGVTRATIYFGGAFEYADSAEFDEPWDDVIVTWPVWVPNDAVVDGTASVVVLVADSAGYTASAVTTVAVKDIARPRTSLDLGGLRGDETI